MNVKITAPLLHNWDLDFPSDHLLIFIGHSDDAKAEAEAILKLEQKIEDEFQLLHKANQRNSPFVKSKVWEWREDASSITGGQDAVVKPALDRAQIAIFVFKERVGAVTWQELQKVRERSRNQRLHILAFFPAKMPSTINDTDDQAIDNWSQLLKCRKELTKDWTDQNGVSVTPCPNYTTIEDLIPAVLEKLKMAMADILAGSPSSHSTPSPDPTPADLLSYYHATLQAQLGDTTLMGSPAFGHVALKLSEIFVSLSLSGSSRSESRVTPQGVCCDSVEYERSASPERVMQSVFFEQGYPLLLIIGDPGSGKTTLLKHYALSCLDATQCERFGFHAPVKLFFLSLRELQKHGESYAPLEEYLAAKSKESAQPIKAEQFRQFLLQPSTLVLLDGLDEISDVSDRIAACKWISTTVHRFIHAKFVVIS